MPDRSTDEPLLDLPAEDSLEHIDDKVQRAQAQLLELRRQQDLIEKQKRELEEASRRQEQFQGGRQEIMEQFTRALVVIERETYEAQKRVEQLKAVHTAFNQHLDHLEAINPKNWEGADLAFINRELNKALGAIDDARAEYAQSRAILNANSASSDEVLSEETTTRGGYQLDYASTGQDFMYWLRNGFAFTLPLLILGLIFLVIFFLASTK